MILFIYHYLFTIIIFIYLLFLRLSFFYKENCTFCEESLQQSVFIISSTVRATGHKLTQTIFAGFGI